LLGGGKRDIFYGSPLPMIRLKAKVKKNPIPPKETKIGKGQVESVWGLVVFGEEDLTKRERRGHPPRGGRGKENPSQRSAGTAI